MRAHYEVALYWGIAGDVLLEDFVAQVQDLFARTVDDHAAAVLLDDDLAVLQLRLRLVVVGFPHCFHRRF